MLKRGIRRLVLGLLRPLRPLLHLYCWWTPIKAGAIRNAVLLPDSMAIFMVAMVGVCLLPYLGWTWIPTYGAVVLFSPAVLLNLVLVGETSVLVLRLVAFVPYWCHRIPAGARFELYEAWEDPAPTGVAFDYRSGRTDPLHLGTSRSAEALYAHLGGLLENAGWVPGLLGHERPTGDTKAT